MPVLSRRTVLPAGLRSRRGTRDRGPVGPSGVGEFGDTPVTALQNRHGDHRDTGGDEEESPLRVVWPEEFAQPNDPGEDACGGADRNRPSRFRAHAFALQSGEHSNRPPHEYVMGTTLHPGQES
jgi:hypothetical protein